MIDLEKIHVIGDKLLIRPVEEGSRTSSGLYLPPSVSEKEKVQSGYVMKTGPGYPMPNQVEDEPWKESKETVKYIPLQVTEGDLALYLKKEAIEIEYEDEKLYIIPQHAVLMVVREDILDDFE